MNGAYCRTCEQWELDFPHPDTARSPDDKSSLVYPGNFKDGRIFYCMECLPNPQRKKRKRREGKTWKLGALNVDVEDDVFY